MSGPRRCVRSNAAEGRRENLSGEPGAAARRWLGRLSIAAFVLFVVTTSLVLSGATRAGIDVPIAHAVQEFPWGPLTSWMMVTNTIGELGPVQELVGAALVAAVFLWDRRAGSLLVLGALASLINQLVRESIQRDGPPANFGVTFDNYGGHSYPSGHAVLFTWVSVMVAAAISPRVGPRWRYAIWSGAAVVIALACIGRVWVGAHWPTDVLGGFLLGLGWSAFVLWLPERWLPSPARRLAPRR